MLLLYLPVKKLKLFTFKKYRSMKILDFIKYSAPAGMAAGAVEGVTFVDNIETIAKIAVQVIIGVVTIWGYLKKKKKD